MKKILVFSILLLAFASCGIPTNLDVEIEEIHADKEVDIAREKTKQAEELTKQKELELKILEENKK